MKEEIIKRIVDKILKIEKSFSSVQLNELEKSIDKGIVNLDKYNNIDIEKNWLKFILIGLTILIFCIIFFVTYPVLYSEQWTEQDERKFNFIIEALKIIGVFIGGGLGLYSIYLGYKRAVAMENSAIAANKTAEANLKNAQTSEDKQITERFSKAIEQLGSDKVEVRLGAIYTLERIAKDSEKDYWTIMEVLTAFVRGNAPLIVDNKNSTSKTFIDDYLINKTEKKESHKLRLDIQEALTVVARLNYKDKPKSQELNLSHINISNAELIGANFTGIYFEGSDFTGAILAGADFTGANLESANLEGANLTSAKFNNAILRFANLTKTIVYDKADFTGVDFFQANFSEAILIECNFTETKLIGANLTKAIFKKANFTGAKLFGADLTEAILEGVDLTKVNLEGANLTNAKFNK